MAGPKKISIHDVARRARVSPATVSNVMNRRRSTEDEIAKRVKKAVNDLGYQPHRAAANLRSGKAQIVAVLVPEIENPFFAEIVAAIECLARDDGFELIIGSSGEDEAVEASRLAAMLAWRPVGMIVIPADDAFANYRQIAAEGTPCVIVDRTSDRLIADTVSVNNRSAGAMALDHLAGLGCRKLLIAASSLKIHNMRERCEGARATATARDLHAVDIVEAGPDYRVASEILRDRLAGPDRPDAVLAMTNVLTLSALSAAAALGISIPDDFALLGFDDYEWMLARKTPVTAVSQPTTEIVEAAWVRLTERMAGDDGAPQSICFDCQLTPRASTLGFGAGGLATEIAQDLVKIQGSPST